MEVFFETKNPEPLHKRHSDKIRILLLSLHYPLTMSKYFEMAFRRRDDVELLTTGPYSGNWIPWKGGMTLPMKYAIPPDFPMDFGCEYWRSKL